MQVYVDAPSYVSNSNGLRCLYALAKELHDRGILVSLLARDLGDFAENLPSAYAGLPVKSYETNLEIGLLIAGESLPPRLIRKARVIGLKILWWYLAPEDVLDVKELKPNDDEPVLVFSSYVGPSPEYFYYQPPLDPCWSASLALARMKKDGPRGVLAVYSGKGCLKILPSELVRYCKNFRSITITRHYPVSRQHLFDLLREVDGVISFDELSQFNLEAASLGIPVLIGNPLYGKSVIGAFPIRLGEYLTSSPAEFMSRVNMFRQLPRNGFSSSELLGENVHTINRIVRLIANPELLENHLYVHQRQALSSFGRDLRSRQVLLPVWRGQSPGTRFFVPYYTNFICGSWTFHVIIAYLARLTDIVITRLLALYNFLKLDIAKKILRRRAKMFILSLKTPA